MFFRLVRLKLREGAFWSFRDYYASRILPALAKTDGCLYAALLRPAKESPDSTCDSITIWRSESDADAYVGAGLYDELLDGADPFLAEATEWSTPLGRPQPGERPPLPDPAVETGTVESAHEAGGAGDGPALFVRIVDHRVEPSRYDDLRAAWDEAVAPELLAAPGCLAAYLVEGLRGRSQALSVSFWASEESAVRYELSGRFDLLVERLRPFLSGIYQWRLSLEPAGESRDLRGSDLAVSSFHVVLGRKLHAPGA